MGKKTVWTIAAMLILAASPAWAKCDDSGDIAELRACLGQDLRESDARINAVYKALMNSEDETGKTALRDQQRAWLKRRDKACALDNKESDREKWLQAILADEAKTLCVVRYTFARVAEFDDMLSHKQITAALPAAPKSLPPAQTTAAALPQAALLNFQDDDYRVDSKAVARSGRRYAEIIIDRPAIAALGDLLLNVDLAAMGGGGVTTAVRIRSGQPGSVLSMGLALDLDNTYSYYRHNGEWRSQPGSTQGLQLKPNRTYTLSIQGSSPLRELINRGLIRVNLGQEPFQYALPDGYRPFAE